jgi:hypothetical protein
MLDCLLSYEPTHLAILQFHGVGQPVLKIVAADGETPVVEDFKLLFAQVLESALLLIHLRLNLINKLDYIEFVVAIGQCEMGKQDFCQVALELGVACHELSENVLLRRSILVVISDHFQICIEPWLVVQLLGKLDDCLF